jgi:hypothetical protein
MADLNPNIKINTSISNSLYTPNNRNLQTRWFLSDLTTLCLKETHFRYNDIGKTVVE